MECGHRKMKILLRILELSLGSLSFAMSLEGTIESNAEVHFNIILPPDVLMGQVSVDEVMYCIVRGSDLDLYFLEIWTTRVGGGDDHTGLEVSGQERVQRG